VSAPATLDVGGRTLRLAGIRSPGSDRECMNGAAGDAEPLPCGELALQALRKRVRGFGVECRIEKGTGDAGLAACRLGRTDLALWLVEQGWAEASDAAPAGYDAAEVRARCGRRGMWAGTPPPGSCRSAR
jgi:endonuclease YncB( thermonuclease family)